MKDNKDTKNLNFHPINFLSFKASNLYIKKSKACSTLNNPLSGSSSNSKKNVFSPNKKMDNKMKKDNSFIKYKTNKNSRKSFSILLSRS